MQAPFKVLYGESIPLTIELLLSRESSIYPKAHIFASNMQQVVYKVKSAMHDAYQA